MDKEVENRIKLIMADLENADEMQKDFVLRNASRYLKETDYIIIKMQEYEMQGKEIENDYSVELQKREECREIIRTVNEYIKDNNI